MTGKNRKASSINCIKDKNGNVLFAEDDVTKRWVEYVSELYNDERGTTRIS